MRESHEEQIVRWAEFVKNNPTKWKSIHTEFINSQFQKSDDFIKRLLKLNGGKEKLIKIYKIQNFKGYKKLFD